MIPGNERFEVMENFTHSSDHATQPLPLVDPNMPAMIEVVKKVASHPGSTSLDATGHVAEVIKQHFPQYAEVHPAYANYEAWRILRHFLAAAIGL